MHTFQNVLNIATDKNELLYVNHSKGISVFNPKNLQWQTMNDFGKNEDLFTRSVSVNHKNEVYFLGQTGLVKLEANQTKIYPLSSNENKVASLFMSACHKSEVWIFSRENNTFYRLKNGKITRKGSKNLSLVLQNRKVTGIKSLPDGKLWIATFSGIICYDADKDVASVFYPDLSFSDVLIDREGNHWFSTLQAGLLRVPDLNYLVWNNSNPDINNEKLTHIATDGTHIYFSSVNGDIGKLDTRSNVLRTFRTGSNADIESLDFDKGNNRLYFHSQHNTYALYNDKLNKEPFTTVALKSVLYAPPYYFLASSSGLYVRSENRTEKISDVWSRELYFDAVSNALWVASNKGLMRFALKQNQWICTDTLFSGTQIISLDFDEKERQFFALAFNGAIYSVNQKIKTVKIVQLPENVQAGKLRFYKEKLYLASNSGVGIFDLSPYLRKKQGIEFLNRLSGLASDNVQDLLLLDGTIWVATGKGLQKIPLSNAAEKPRAKIYLNNVLPLNPSRSVGTGSPKGEITIQLRYGEVLTLFPEASIYSANGNFEYAYRINQGDWLKLPATVEQIEIQNLPAGKFEIELKVIDHKGRDSENKITVSGVVKPPFWWRWWFVLGVVLILLGVAFLFYKSQLAKQKKELKRQNELNIAKLTAIRSQMNPHFIFNSLNSIQDLILQKKTVESYDYVVLFSELVRSALNYSNKDFISIREEIEFLDTYLQLEQLRFKDDFHYSIHYDGTDDIDVPSLMVQPFAENALFHGLLHKEGKKELTIRFTFDNHHLVCVIEDNGIGRQRAEKIRTRQGVKHGSFALDAIQKRLDMFNVQQGGIAGKFLFEDIFPDETDTGTRVIIRLPFKRCY